MKIACHSGDLKMCEFLLKLPDLAVMALSKDNTSPLHYLVGHCYAAEENYFLSILQLMVQQGASVNPQTLHGETPLHRYLLGYYPPFISSL